MTTRDVPVIKGKHLRMCGDVGVGELGPTPNTCDDDAARRHWVEVPDLRDTFHEGCVELLEKPPPPTTCPSELFLCQHRGRSGSLACSSLRPALNSNWKFFPARQDGVRLWRKYIVGCPRIPLVLVPPAWETTV